MKDSRIGAYGVIGLVLSLGLRWVALWLLLEQGMLCGLIVVATLSRAAMVPVMAALPHARTNGLSHHVGRPSVHTAWIALAIGFVVSVVFAGLSTVSLLIAGVVVTSLWAVTAKRKIGGQTGDILGATQQFNEIALLLVLTL